MVQKLPAGHSSWPNIYVSSFGSDKIGRVLKIDGNNPSSFNTVSQLENLSGATGFDKVDDCYTDPNSSIKLYKFYFTHKPGISNFVQFPNGRLIASNTTTHSIVDVTSANSFTLGGYRKIASDGTSFDLNTGGSGFDQRQKTLCTTLNLDCSVPVYLNQTQSCNVALGNHDQGGSLSSSLTKIPVSYSGFNDFTNGIVNGSGSFGTSNFSNVGFNNPSGMTISPTGKLVVAETGSNVVYEINSETGTMKVKAGSYDASDRGDGSLAAPPVTYDIVKREPIKSLKELIFGSFVEKAYATVVNYISNHGGAGIYHPKGVAFDAGGNLYITSENGYIRKVDAQGIISTYAGKKLDDGGILADSIHAELMVLNNPTGLVIDSINQEMFVADTGNNRIVKIDMQTKIASTIAGDGNCNVNPKDGGSALAASVCSPTWLGLDGNSNLLVIDSGHQRIRRIILNGSLAQTLSYLPSNNDLSVLQKQADGSFIQKTRDGAQLFFNQVGLETTAVDRVGNTSSFQYDQANRISSVTDSVGQVSQFNYSGNKLSSFVDPANRSTNFIYDGDNLVKVFFPDNTQKAFAYDADGILLNETDNLGNQVQYVYNTYGRLQSVVDPEGKVTQVADLVSGTIQNPQREGLGAGKANSNLTNANNSSVKLTKDANGIVRKIQDPIGRITEIISDLAGKPLQENLPDSSVIKFTYDPVTSDLLAQQNVTTGISQSKTYNQFGQVLTQTDANNNTLQNIYADTTGLLVNQIFPNNIQVNNTFNSSGLPISKTVYPSGQAALTTSFFYDSLGRQIKTISADGKTMEYSYDSAGNVLSATSHKDATTSFTTTYTYDLFNRLTKVTSAKGEVTQYAYLATGKLSKITDPKGQVTLFNYDRKGQLLSKTEADAATTIFEYDGVGNTTKVTDANGTAKFFSYNANNKVILATYPEEIITYDYDLNGEIFSVSSNNGNKTYYNRDQNRRVIQEVNFWNTLSYTSNIDYDLNGNRKRASISSNNFTASVSVGRDGLYKLNDISYNYDANNRLTAMSNFLGDSFAFNYDQSNRLTSVVRPGSRTDYTFSGPMLSSITHSSGAATKSFNQYTYDNRNLITQKRNPGGIFDYSYDQNGQLTNTNQSQPAGNPESFSYDEIGNRLSTGQFVQTYDSTSQRIQDDGVFTYTFDKTGNIISKNSKSGGQSYIFQYSSRNQLTQALIYDSPLGKRIKAISYNYDPGGRRIAKFINTYSDGGRFPTASFAKKYAYDGVNIVAELDSDNKILARYTHSPLSPDDLLAVNFTNHAVTAANGGDALSSDYVMSDKVGSFYYLKDNLNSVTDVADGSGNIIQRYDYYSFGTLRSIKDSTGRTVDIGNAPIRTLFTYTGREFETETGLYYYRARYYDPNTGRFLQKDPHPGKMSMPVTVVNKYSYSGNNPISLSDPSGMSWLSDAWDKSNEWTKDIVIAAATLAVLVVCGAGLAGAAFAVGGAAAGAAAAALVLASFQGGNFWSNAGSNFHSAFRLAAGMLVVGSLLSLTSGGLTGAGGDIFHGYIETKNPIFGFGGDLTIGNASWYAGSGAFDATYLHSIGHLMQFYGAIAIGGQFGLNFDQSAGLYGGWSLTGVNNGAFLSAPESLANYLGGIFAPGF